MAASALTSKSPESDRYLSPSISVIENDPSSTSSAVRTQMSMVEGGASERHKLGHRRVDPHGKVTYKKFQAGAKQQTTSILEFSPVWKHCRMSIISETPTSELMAAIQLGIGQSITSMSLKPNRDLLLQDFAVVETVHFPKVGSSLTPAHEYEDFKFRTYAPVAFRYFKELFGIPMDAFLVSVCNNPLKELSNPGASGSIFYLTHDDEFIIKTVQHKEAEFLQKLLPGYYMNLNQNPRTLLPKFYGLYCYQSGNKNIRFVVMNNLLPSLIRLHEKYDLKGSTYKRKASQAELSKGSPTLKDLDFRDIHPDGIKLEAETYTALLKTVDRDVRVLQSFQIMDYSMLLAVHNLDKAEEERGTLPRQPSNVPLAGRAATGTLTGTLTKIQRLEPGRGKSVHQRLAHYSNPMEAIHARADPLEIDEDNIPPGGVPARNSKGERLLLYIGIIDILQSYRLSKKLEHAMKSVVSDGDTISVHRPGFYAQRFHEFFNKTVFQKVASLDEPKMKGNRFKKIVQVVQLVTTLKSGQSRDQGDEGEESGHYIGTTDEPNRSSSRGPLIRGRPDVLPDTTPPQTLNSGSHSSLQQELYRQLQYDLQRQQQQQQLDQQRHAGGGGRGLEPSNSEEHLSSLNSYALSTPTHTDFTEGVPSYTASSPSVSSDILGTPAHQKYDSGLNLPTSTRHEVHDSNEVFINVPYTDNRDSASSAYFSETSVRSTNRVISTSGAPVVVVASSSTTTRL